jgi:serine/threonine protein phosphatase PrpC
MEEGKAKLVWRIVGKSVRGASHVRSGLPNQDAIHWTPQSGTTPPLILAVSDGHGSNKCFRSDVGSDLAVHIATKVFQELLDGQPDLQNLSAIKRTAEERLPQSLVREWKSAVEDHLSKNAFSDEEWARLAEKEGPAARQAVEANPPLAYGATLLTALVADNFILYLQLGDGEILTVAETGEVSKPLPGDERLMANETTSLCGPSAWRDFRFGFQPLSASAPALILLSTDGYPNSFQDEAGFLKVGSDFLDMIRSDGLDKVSSNLETWLAEASQAGSGDDVTVGIIKRAEEKDIDSVLRRLNACETELRDKKDQKARIDEQGNRLQDVEGALRDAKEQNEKIVGQVFKLRWGLVVAALLATTGIVLALVLWIQSGNPFPQQKGAATVSPANTEGGSAHAAPRKADKRSNTQ